MNHQPSDGVLHSGKAIRIIGLSAVFFVIFIGVALLINGCTPAPAATVTVTEPAKTVTVTTTVTPTLVAVPTPTVSATRLTAIQTAWQGSDHNAKYDLGKGVNDFCGRCHDPQNWRPSAVPNPTSAGIPGSATQNCISCKGAPSGNKLLDASPYNILIPEDKYKAIGCAVCHKVTNNVVDPKPAMINKATNGYDAVANSTELCEKCHCDTLGGSKHRIEIGGNAHVLQIGMTENVTSKLPLTCTGCHDAHSLQVSCSNANCHKNTMTSPTRVILGHDANHLKVDCAACHESKGGFGFGWATDNTGAKIFTTGTWATANEVQTFTAVHTHVISKTPAAPATAPRGSSYCAKCHFDKNPAGLSVQK